MQRSFLTRTLIAVVPTLIATGLVIWAYAKDPVTLRGFKRGIDLSGGTILVYEVDRAATTQSQMADAGRAPVQADNALAAALKRRRRSWATATRRDHFPWPCGIAGPATHSVSPRASRSTPSFT